MNIFKIFFILFSLFTYLNAKAFNIIRDAETENFIYEIINPLIKKSTLKDIKIYLVNDSSVNAFTIGKDTIFVNTGVITVFNDMSVLYGVIAHELAHILSHHVSLQQQNINSANNTFSIINTIGLLTSLITGKADGFITTVVGASDYSGKLVMKYSRIHEFTADKVAINLLNKVDYCTDGLIKLFKYLNESTNTVDPYLMSHPLTKDRIQYIKTHSKNKCIFLNSKLQEKYSFIRAKIKAYTESVESTLKLNDSPENIYAKAILFARISNFNRSIFFINKLINSYPNNPYFYELKAEILFNFGKKESINFYQKAINILPNNNLLKLGRVKLALNLFSVNNFNKFNVKNDLMFILNREPNNLLGWQLLASYYDKINDKGASLVTLAVIQHKIGNKEQTLKLANLAIKYLKPNTPNWKLAQDLINLN